MGIYELISVIASVISFFALIGNILQFTKKREMSKDLLQMVQTQYNNYYLIARAVTRINSVKASEDIDMSQLIRVYDDDINFIRGVADSARIQMINFSKNELGKDVYYQHPAYPNKKEFSEAVKMGLPPEKEDSSDKIEVAKKIMMSKNYTINKPKDKTIRNNSVSQYILLNEDNGGIPGSNIEIVEYSNTKYFKSEIHDDQAFFYVVSGVGKAKIGESEINILEGSMFVVPPKTLHTILSRDSNKPVKVLCMHNS